MSTAQAMRNADNVIELPDNFAGSLASKPTGQQKGERLEDACRVESAFCSQAIADTLRRSRWSSRCPSGCCTARSR